MPALMSRVVLLATMLILGVATVVFLQREHVAEWKESMHFGASWEGDYTPPKFGVNGTPPPPPPAVSEDGALKKAWVGVAKGTVVGEPWDDGAAIGQLCAKTKLWKSDVVFECSDSQGGIGNIRQDIMSCLRYAIDAGAGLLLPVVTLRSEDLTKLNTLTYAPMSYLFDTDTFVARLKQSCPKLTVYQDQAELEAIAPVKRQVLAPRDIQRETGETVLSIQKQISEHRAEFGQITIVVFLITLAYYPVCVDPTPFVNQYSNLLPLRDDVRELALAALFEMGSRFELEIHPNSPTTPQQYVGAHLRTSADAVAMGWPSYDMQADRYLGIAQEKGMKVIFVASGNVTSVEMFRTAAWSLTPPIAVVTKHDLLSEANRALLSKLTWDQQALVDWILLERSSYFVGLSESSFSWNIALRRRVLTASGSCPPGQLDRKLSLEPVKLKGGIGTVYRDELSDLMGGHASDWEVAMWP